MLKKSFSLVVQKEARSPEYRRANDRPHPELSSNDEKNLNRQQIKLRLKKETISDIADLIPRIKLLQETDVNRTAWLDRWIEIGLAWDEAQLNGQNPSLVINDDEIELHISTPGERRYFNINRPS